MICQICRKELPIVSKFLKVCLNCIRNFPEEAFPFVQEAHRESREKYHLPFPIPHDPLGLKCNLCANECQVPEGEVGFCGLRRNIGGRLIGPLSEEAKVSWYLDPLPTNCVADWVCPAGTGCGYPQYAYKNGPEYGYYNLAVFFHACSLNCLFCQNWQFKELSLRSETRKVEELVDSVNFKVSCICFFGGDPSPQLPFAIKVSEKTLENTKGRILRICWETNGLMNRELLKRVIELSLISGGCIKIDLKAWDKNLHVALTGISNERILDNFAFIAQYIDRRPQVPLLIASTLLIPGYIDEREVEGIAKFIAQIDKNIPYRLLAFYPHFYMSDLPLTSKELAYRCYDVAIKMGLKNVAIGNIHLLR
ncbi:MAG: radical SAM protein [Synergistetes bacterium]|nr:radical SAM protein [Synergistota bacterium]MCX8127704.1 radical SAM protein [Synergistota bacterium]MDW8191381.1 radical SAM protein [Synergistota bacterium]